MIQSGLPSAAEVARTLRDIRAGPEFESFDQGLLARFLAWGWARFMEWLDRVLPDIPRGLSEPLAALVLAALVGAAVFAAARWRSGRRPTPAYGDPDDVREEPRTAGDWLRLAAARARAMEYRRAATALYQGFVLTLDGRGAVAFHPSKTPGEYVLEAGAAGVVDGPRLTDVGAFMRRFETMAFGHRPPTSPDYRRLERLARRMGCDVAGEADA